MSETSRDTLEQAALHVDFRGPFTFIAGERSLFHCEHRDAQCVYLWTIRSAADERYYIHYVGEAEAFARRQREHLIQVLGLNYGILDVEAARQGDAHWIWEGMWRDRSWTAPERTLTQYPMLATAVAEYVNALEVFVAPLEADRQLRRRIEGELATRLRQTYPDACLLYPADNRVGRSAHGSSLRVHISAAAPIPGLAAVIDLGPNS